MTEAETPDIELDTLPVDEIVRRICRRLGRSPDPALPPWAWDDAGGDDEPPLLDLDPVAAEPVDDALDALTPRLRRLAGQSDGQRSWTQPHSSGAPTMKP